MSTNLTDILNHMVQTKEHLDKQFIKSTIDIEYLLYKASYKDHAIYLEIQREYSKEYRNARDDLTIAIVHLEGSIALQNSISLFGLPE